MKKSLFLLFCLALISIGFTTYINSGRDFKYQDLVDKTPAVTKQTPSPTGTLVPLGKLYTNDELGITFQYPENFFIVETPKYNRIQIQNFSQQQTGPDPAFRGITLNYGTFAAQKSDFERQKEVGVTFVNSQGARINLYEHPNPVIQSSKIVGALWNGKTTFSITMIWNRISSDPMNGIIQSDEAELLRKIVPTIVTRR